MKTLVLRHFLGGDASKNLLLLSIKVVRFPRRRLRTVLENINMDGYRSGHNGAVLKTVRVQAHGGSNPSPSVI